ncbi:MAG: TraC family protein [Candidatus Paceibacterota bacterium]
MPEAATQDFLKFDQVREGVVILKNKALRGILMVNSLNFALKTSDQKKSIIYQFQEMLNSLDFPLQIYLKSRQLNITGYLDKLEQLQKEQDNELLQTQTESYRKFIDKTVQKNTIMSKNFFVVVPYTLREAQRKSGGKMPKRHKMTEQKFQRAKRQLWQRMEFVALGLRRCSLKAVPLTTPEIIELFWSIHHPRRAEVGYYPEIPPEITQQNQQQRVTQSNFNQ